MKQSLAKFMQQFPKDVDAALIINDDNRTYLTGFKSSAGNLLITKEKAWLIIDGRYFEKASEVVEGVEVVLLSNLSAQITERLQAVGAKVLGVESNQMVLKYYNNLKADLKDNFTVIDSNTVSNLIEELKMVKFDYELELMKKAQSITDKTFEYMLGIIKPGMTEREIATELEYFMKKNGATGFAFDTICVAGPNSSLPHGVPTDRKIQSGDFLTMDFGAMYNGYCSDMTRTIGIGKLSDEQVRCYNTVHEAQQKAFDKIATAKAYKEVDLAAREYIDSTEFKGLFTHGLGHSLGILLHEDPGFSRGCTLDILPGSIITVEPGIYKAGQYGVRIEDMVYLKGNGEFENLTHSDKSLIIL
ncbi:MAG: aminopeptidase P family protein [Oscillospiraceae bacterium]